MDQVKKIQQLINPTCSNKYSFLLSVCCTILLCLGFWSIFTLTVPPVSAKADGIRMATQSPKALLVEEEIGAQKSITDTQLLIPLFFAVNPRRHENDPTNHAPVILQILDQTSIAREFTDLEITAFDVEGDPLLYSADGLPEGIFISSSGGFLTGVATNTGTYTITIAVDDGIGPPSTQQFVWNIFAFEQPTLPQVDGSVARLWNEVLLESIREDYARPTVHARNLFHTSIGMYDAWAAYDATAETYLFGKTVDGFSCETESFDMPDDVGAAREEAISYAAYRLLQHRFADSPTNQTTLARFDLLMSHLGYDTAITSTDYITGSAAALGNTIGNCLIDFGLQDGANEANDYTNRFYASVNPPLSNISLGNPDIIDADRWQPLLFEQFIEQGGQVSENTQPDFVSPEWGMVAPFALQESERTIYERDGHEYWVYHDPGPPPYINKTDAGLPEEYQWGFSLVSVWSTHLDPEDGVMWDISPASIGNLTTLPETVPDLPDFYQLQEGGDGSSGREMNPFTGEPYAPQVVPRGDYTRVLAEFWADGPDSETPPGHWFTILNYVNDSPQFEKRYKGEGPILDDLEWDVKSYFALGGTVHDAAVAAWGVKGWYDYVRPFSAIRHLAEVGQSTDPSLPRYDAKGIPLIEGYIEVVQSGDPLAGTDNRNVGKIKILAWKGPLYIFNPETSTAGVDWILAERWWPYQRLTFVTPPFAGYVSGHSTYSRAAAELLTLLTGDEYFPGGMGEFIAKRNSFLVFEDGPSVEVALQWATYRDAADQCSLSRIWGGIHPPADDIAGRKIGEQVGIAAFELADSYILGTIIENRLE